VGEAKARARRRERDRLARRLPENFRNLHDGELAIREQAIAAIESDPELMDHVELLEVVMDFLDFFARRKPTDLDQETVLLLGARVFNDLAASFGMLVGGYYQIAAAIQRDVMEIVFLLGMFDRDRSKIIEWRQSDRKTRLTSFQPGKVRNFLDTYDGFTGKKRDKAYQMFYEYAAHATWHGFALMGPAHKPTIGPFFDQSLMKSVIEELAQLAAQVGNNFAEFVGGNDVQALETKLHRLETTALWGERYFGRKADRKAIRELKRMLAEIKR
jgi:hypothetical protein